MTPEQLALQERRKIIGTQWVTAINREDMRHEAERRQIDDAHRQQQIELQQACIAAGGHIDDGGFMYGCCKVCGYAEM